ERLDCEVLQGRAGAAAGFWRGASGNRGRSRRGSGPYGEDWNSWDKTAPLTLSFAAQWLHGRESGPRCDLRARTGEWFAGDDSHWYFNFSRREKSTRATDAV